MQPIYLDFAAATPLDERVFAMQEPFLRDDFYNPSSSYLAAKKVRQALESSRERVAHWLGAKPGEVIFTAGATESINLAISGVMSNFPAANVVVLATEHDAVLAAAHQYSRGVVKTTTVGVIDMSSLKREVDDSTILISVAMANNEIGTIQPMREIAAFVQQVRKLRQLKNNSLPLYLHTDASQAACYLDIHASRLGVDMLTLNGGKMYGPKQTGVLFVKTGVMITPQVVGGGQERGMRSGTENVAGVVGLAAALDIAQAERKEAIIKTAALRDSLQSQICTVLPQTIVNGNPKKRLPNNLHLSWAGIDGERLLMLLDERGIMASTGSACAANKQTASHVLVACGLDDQTIQGSLRLTLGRTTTQQHITHAASIIVKVVQELTSA